MPSKSTKAENLFSAFGSAGMHQFRFMWSLIRVSLLVGFFKALKLFIATLDGQVQSFFGLLFATPDAF